MIKYELIIALISLILANIVLGSTMANINYQFDKKVFLKGLFKAIMVVVSLALLYVGATLSKDIMVLSIDGTNYNLIEAINVVTVAGIGFYGKEVVTKIIEMLNLNVKVEDKQEQSTIKVPEENLIERDDE